MNESNVVCRQLGYPLGAVEPLKSVRIDGYAQTGRAPLINNVDCSTGLEARIQDCSYNLTDTCGSNQWLRVRCAGT